MATIFISTGAARYVGGTIQEINGKDISGDTFQMGLSLSSSIPPTVWITPDSSTVGTTVSYRILKLLVSSTAPASSPVTVGNTYYSWCKVVDSPEIEPRVLNTFTTA